ncbi:MAG TPA: addiction module protein [Thermoanaerobaculia bacterium]|nr:addiction module protein [Thermoanaerobaculia bacterium]
MSLDEWNTLEDVKRRYKAIQDGKAELIPAEEVYSELLAEEAPMKLKEVQLEALKLSHDERLELAYSLIRSVDDEGESRETERLWAEEAERRYQDFLDGKVQEVPGEEAIRRIRAALQR